MKSFSRLEEREKFSIVVVAVVVVAVVEERRHFHLRDGGELAGKIQRG